MNKNFQMGIFFILGIVILLVLFEVVSGVSILKKDKLYYTYFQSVGELRSGSQVKLSGVNIGKVNRISLSGQNVEVQLSIDKDIIIKEDSVASINMTSLLGSSYIGITFGDVNSKILAEGGIINSAQTVDFNSLISKLDNTVTIFNNQFSGYSDKINSILFNLDDIISNIANSKGSVGKLVNESDLYDELIKSLNYFSSISKKIDTGEGTLGKLINDEEIYFQANKTLKTLNYLTEKVATGEGSLGKLVNDDKLYRNDEGKIVRPSDSFNSFGVVNNSVKVTPANRVDTEGRINEAFQFGDIPANSKIRLFFYEKGKTKLNDQNERVPDYVTLKDPKTKKSFFKDYKAEDFFDETTNLATAAKLEDIEIEYNNKK